MKSCFLSLVACYGHLKQVYVLENSASIACVRLKGHTKEAIVAQGYIRSRTMNWIDVPIYPKRRLWRHMSESRMSNFPRAIKRWQSVCSFVANLLMFRQDTMLLCPALKPRRKLVFRLGTFAAQASQDPVWENLLRTYRYRTLKFAYLTIPLQLEYIRRHTKK